MHPTKIEKATHVMHRPAGTLEEDCHPLHVRMIHDPIWGNQMWSKWLPSDEEIELLRAGAGIYLIITGVSHPVVSLAIGTHIEGDEI